MKRLSKISGFVAALAVGAVILPAAVHADDKDVIDYRQNIMKALDAQSAALGQILSTAIPDDNVVSHLETIAATAASSLKSFEAKVPGGESKPAVWDNWADFSKRMNDFAEKTATAAKVAKESGKDAALGNILDALTCKSCHDVYREKK